MKKLALSLVVLGVAFSGAVAADGATVYKKCIACHGPKAEKVYLNKIPALKTLDPEEMVQNMIKYKAGEMGENGKGLYNMGAIMKGQMATLSEDDMKAVVEYIQTLK